jgi:hypothetical protein
VVRRGDVLVEPILSDAVSSPRRSLKVTKLDEKRDPRWHRELVQSAGGALLQPCRVLLGREPIELSLEAVWVDVEHVATYRLGPVYCEVRQRTIEPETESGLGRPAAALPTVALRLWPNPEPREEDRGTEQPRGEEPEARETKAEAATGEEPGAQAPEAEEETAEGPGGEAADVKDPGAQKPAAAKPQGPVLVLEAARLLAATMRAVLPSMYRGGAESVGVAVQVTEPLAKREHPASGPAPEDAPASPEAKERPPRIDLFLFDTDAGGNGAARAIYRDGADLLLRLCRLVVERVLSLDRMLAIYDEWGDRREIHQEARAEAGVGKRVEDLARERREKHEKLRLSLLEWLDSRLPPEAGAEGQRDLARYFESGSERGEGAVVDLGRCWYSSDGSVTDLLWAKHRWQHPHLGEVMLDLGFDRKTYLAARQLRATLLQEPDQAKKLYRVAAERHGRDELQDPRCKPQRVSFLDPASGELGVSDEDRPDIKATAIALWTVGASPSPLLSEVVGCVSAKTAQEAELAANLTAFVQGLPNTSTTLDSGRIGPAALLESLRSPIEALLERRADSVSKALLLAALLSRAGISAGLFLSLEDGGRAFGAIRSETGVPGDRLEKAPFWADLPAKNGPGGHSKTRFLPIDLSRYCGLGEVRVDEGKLERWVFLPMLHLIPPPRDEPESPSPKPISATPAEMEPELQATELPEEPEPEQFAEEAQEKPGD